LPKKDNQDQTPAEERESAAKVAELEQLVAQKESELALKDSRIAELEQAVASRDSQLAELESRLSQAVEAYRALVIKANPAVPAELISGESVEEIDKSLANARVLVDRVRQELESEIAAAKIPAGAPPRTSPDFSALSPKEKIQYAIGERR
jgi:uncharacterized coiled-coil protein SlyX